MALRAHLIVLNFRPFLIFICLKLSLAAIPSSTKLCQPTLTPYLERIVTVMEEVWPSEIIGKERSIFACGSEIIWSTIIKVGSSQAFHLASYYRPPYSSQEVLEHFLDSFNSIFESSNHHPNIVAAGDFNLKGINLWIEVPSATNQATSLNKIDHFHLWRNFLSPTMWNALLSPSIWEDPGPIIFITSSHLFPMSVLYLELVIIWQYYFTSMLKHHDL